MNDYVIGPIEYFPQTGLSSKLVIIFMKVVNLAISMMDMKWKRWKYNITPAPEGQNSKTTLHTHLSLATRLAGIGSGLR